MHSACVGNGHQGPTAPSFWQRSANLPSCVVLPGGTATIKNAASSALIAASAVATPAGSGEISSKLTDSLGSAARSNMTVTTGPCGPGCCCSRPTLLIVTAAGNLLFTPVVWICGSEGVPKVHGESVVVGSGYQVSLLTDSRYLYLP